ncbi:hypothetical protein CBS101457_004848 [Exobasidium rhododendri]|nr:hypothetical protein CBS101457_004848 [Exobasidium rhododendri]
MSQREDIRIPCHNDILAAWLYPAADASSSSSASTSSEKRPAIVLAHGLGAVKEMRLDAYSETFSAEGYICVAFDYRCSGASTGKPAGLVDVEMQLEDWRVVIEYVRSLPSVDPTRIGIFGSSFGGGNVIRVAARDPTIKAVISQCPFTSGFHSTLTTGVWAMPGLLSLGVRDNLFGTDDDPVLVPLIGPPNSAALMNAPDAVSGSTALLPPGYVHKQAIPARFTLQIPFMRPGAYAKLIKAPIFFAICGRDTVAPAGPTLSYAKTAQKPTIQWYEDMGHFDIYLGEAYKRATKDYIQFLRKNLPVKQ